MMSTITNEGEVSYIIRVSFISIIIMSFFTMSTEYITTCFFAMLIEFIICVCFLMMLPGYTTCFLTMLPEYTTCFLMMLPMYTTCFLTMLPEYTTCFLTMFMATYMCAISSSITSTITISIMACILSRIITCRYSSITFHLMDADSSIHDTPPIGGFSTHFHVFFNDSVKSWGKPRYERGHYVCSRDTDALC